MRMNKEFPNGFTSWHETHYEVVAVIQYIFTSDNYNHPLVHYFDREGTEGLYELARRLTDEFEKVFEDADWGGDLNYFDTLHKFLTDEFRKL